MTATLPDRTERTRLGYHRTADRSKYHFTVRCRVRACTGPLGSLKKTNQKTNKKKKKHFDAGPSAVRAARGWSAVNLDRGPSQKRWGQGTWLRIERDQTSKKKPKQPPPSFLCVPSHDSQRPSLSTPFVVVGVVIVILAGHKPTQTLGTGPKTHTLPRDSAKLTREPAGFRGARDDKPWRHRNYNKLKQTAIKFKLKHRNALQKQQLASRVHAIKRIHYKTEWLLRIAIHLQSRLVFTGNPAQSVARSSV